LTCNGTKIGVHVLHAFQHLFLHKSTDGPLETLERTRISMNRLASFQIKKAKDKDEARARQRRRKEIELEWNRAIRRVIDRYQAATPATIAACLDVNPVPQTPQERTQLRQLYHRLERNALHGRFRALYEYDVQAHGKDIAKAKQRMHAGHVYYVSLEVSRKEGIQYEHKAFIAHTRATLERAIDFDTCKTDTKLRDEAGTEELIFDFYGVKGATALAVECNLSDWPKEISKKCQKWEKERNRFSSSNFDITDYRYVWVAETETKARNIRDQWIKDGLTANYFLVTWSGAFNPYRPASILECIWLWPQNNQLQKLEMEQWVVSRRS
jgi:hypothetical protein